MSKTYVIRNVTPESNNKWYYDAKNNIYYAKGFMTCTGYAFGRFSELFNKKCGYKDTWYPIDMWNRVSEAGFKKCSKPKVGGGVVWQTDDKKTSHIAIIEKLDGSDFYASMFHVDNSFEYKKYTKSSNYNYGSGWNLVGFIDPCVTFVEDTKNKPSDNYNDNTIPNRFKVIVDGKQIEADTYYENAKNTADKYSGTVVDGTNGETIYVGKKPVQSTKVELNEKSYPDYVANTKKFYYVMTSKGRWVSSKGAFTIWKNAYNAYKKVENKTYDGEKYHIFDAEWKQLV